MAPAGRKPSVDAVDKEIPLHEQIMKHCDSQFPRWKYIRARSDKESTIGVGAQDFTIFLPGRKLLCVECKAKNGKLSEYQRIWIKEMEMLDHPVHLVFNFDEFLNLTQTHEI